jgi:hypothetical protein
LKTSQTAQKLAMIKFVRVTSNKLLHIAASTSLSARVFARSLRKAPLQRFHNISFRYVDYAAKSSRSSGEVRLSR